MKKYSALTFLFVIVVGYNSCLAQKEGTVVSRSSSEHVNGRTVSPVENSKEGAVRTVASDNETVERELIETGVQSKENAGPATRTEVQTRREEQKSAEITPN